MDIIQIKNVLKDCNAFATMSGYLVWYNKIKFTISSSGYGRRGKIDILPYKIIL